MRTIITVLFVFFLSTPWLFAATIYVDSNSGSDITGDGSLSFPYKTFHKAYTMAANGDVVHLSGTFTWTDADEIGDVATDGYVIDKDLTIEGEGVDVTIVQADVTENTADRCVFTINGGKNVTIRNLTIRHGKVTPTTEGKAGGITCAGAILTLDKVRITKNRFDNSNTVQGAGGVIGWYVWSSYFTHLTMTNCTVDNNYYNGRLYGAGGVYLSYAESGTNIQNCTFSDNKAYAAIATSYPYEYSSPAGALCLNRRRGFEYINIYNNTFTNNYSDAYAGAINLGNDVNTIFNNNTVVNNQAELGAAGVLSDYSKNIYFKNNLVANNLVNSSGQYNDLYITSRTTSSFHNEGYNLVEFSTNFTPATGDITGEQPNLNISTTLADNGTLNGTQTLALQTGSVAINAGDDADIVAGSYTFSIPTTDQRGISRVVGRVDIGAYESSYPTATQPAGSGTQGDPYLISNLSELYWIQEQWESGNQFSNTYFRQTADIDASETQYWFEGEGWKPIGNEPMPFWGYYDGNNFRIQNLTINRPTSDYIGLFGDLDNDLSSYAVQNLHLTNVNITGNNNVGGLTGYLEYQTVIYNCSVSGMVTVKGNYGGGLAGAGWYPKVLNCSSSVNLIVQGTSYFGGITGSAWTHTLTQCFFDGTIHIEADASYIGGLVGIATYGTVERCYSTGNMVEATSHNTQNVGGIVGLVRGAATIRNSYSTGNVRGNTNVGGLIGTVAKYSSYFPELINSYAASAVTGQTNIGGLIGSAEAGATITGCFWDTDVSGQSGSAGGSGLSTAQMKNHNTFLAAGWDFVLESANGSEDIWDIDYSGTINNGYPYLSWQDGEDTSLPVELASFSAELIDGAVKLTWITESELNNAGFILERSADQQEWVVIASYENNDALKGQGNSNGRTTYTFIDKNVVPGHSWYYRLADVSTTGEVTYHHPLAINIPSDPSNPQHNVPLTTRMENAYPNPFNPETYIAYSLGEDDVVTIVVYDLLGRQIKTLHKGFQKAGQYHVYWQGNNDAGERVPSGLYIIRMKTAKNVQSQKVMLVK